MKHILKTIVSLILVVALLLPATSCAVNGVADVIRESNVMDSGDINYSKSDIETDRATEKEMFLQNSTFDKEKLSPPTKETGEYVADVIRESNATNSGVVNCSKSGVETDSVSEKETFLQDSTLDKEDLSPPKDENGNFVSEEFLSEAEMAEFLLCIEEFKKQDIFSFATDCIAYDLYDAGYDVFHALAIVGEEMVPGLAFTKYETYETTEERTIYNCGFVQLTESGVDADVAITRENVDQGVVVVPYGEYDTSTGFIISMGISLPSYSGIYNNYYFRYDQVSDYTVSISVQDNDRSVWDESIDFFNFTENKFVFKGDMSYNGTSASPYFSDEAKAYAAAREAVDKIIEYQESNAYKAEKQVIIIFTEDVLNEYLLNNQQGTINGFLLDKIDEIEVAENQFVVVTTEGVTVVETVVDTDALARERLTNGILGFIGSALLVVGSVFITVATCGAGAPLAVSAICVAAGAGATLYGVSQMIEAGQEIYYGATGDIYSESFNPLLEAFQVAIPDDELATKVYHIFGISCSLVNALTAPANAALALPKGATVWQTTLSVTRAVAVEVVKMAVTGVVAAGVGYGTNVIVTDLTGSENWGKIAGFGSSLLAGMFTYKGLNKLDAKYNFSGLNTKAQVLASKEKQTVKQYKDNDPNMSADDYKALDDKFDSASKRRHEVKNEWFKENHKGEEWYKVYEDGYIVENGKAVRYTRHYFENADGTQQLDIKFYRGRWSNK